MTPKPRQTAIALILLAILAACIWAIRKDARPSPGKVSGTVVYQDGTPARGITVSVQRPEEQAPTVSLLARIFEGPGAETWGLMLKRLHEQKSDQDGNFRFNSVLPGHFRLQADTPSLPQFATSTPTDIYLLKPEETTTGLQLVIECGLLIKGTVTDHATSAPVSGATIGWLNQDEDIYTSATTGADGSYILCCPMPDRSREQTTSASKSGFLPETKRLIMARGPAIQVVDFKLKPTRRIMGIVTDAEGNPLQGAEVFAGHSYSDKGQIEPPAVTDVRGTFSVNAPYAGNVYVYAEMENRPCVSAPAPDPEGPETSVTLVLEKGSTITGTILTHDDKPAANVYVHTTVISPPRPGLNNHLPHTRTSADGTYTFTNVPPGNIRVYGQEEFNITPPQFLEMPPGALRSNIDLKFRKGFMVSGTVTDEQGTSVADAWVDLHPVDENEEYVFGTVRADSNGDFHIRGIPDVPVNINARSYSFKQEYKGEALNVNPGDMVPQNIVLKKVNSQTKRKPNYNSPIGGLIYVH